MMTRQTRSLLRVAGILAAALFTLPVLAAQPITTDSRIKTLVFNPNEVFVITTHYGYQSNIEFGAKETIDTISVGDRVAWQITPAGRRLFIRAQEENAHTNMTVVTNLHAYQFDLRSSSADAVFGSEELTYVVRFFYPDDAAANMAPLAPPLLPAPAVTVTQPPPTFAPAPTVTTVAPAPSVSAVVPPPSVTTPMPTGNIPAPAFNYNYTFSGSSPAPVKIFDDGKNTYFKFSNGVSPRISVITAKGETLAVPSHVTNDGLIAVNVVAPRFSLVAGSQLVIVYNESGGVM